MVILFDTNVRDLSERVFESVAVKRHLFLIHTTDIHVIHQHRRDYNRLGFSVQLCGLCYLGWTLSDVKEIPENVLRDILPTKLT